jgi:hypothetical protein
MAAGSFSLSSKKRSKDKALALHGQGRNPCLALIGRAKASPLHRFKSPDTFPG